MCQILTEREHIFMQKGKMPYFDELFLVNVETLFYNVGKCHVREGTGPL